MIGGPARAGNPDLENGCRFPILPAPLKGNPDGSAATKQATGRTLEGRVAVVTGAGTGIGRGIAIACAKEGANLVMVGRRLEPLEEAASAVRAAGGEVRLVQGSVTEREVAKRAAVEAESAFGRVDILVNNAHSFTNPHYSVEETPEEFYRIHMESGFFGTLHFMQELFPLLRERGVL